MSRIFPCLCLLSVPLATGCATVPAQVRPRTTSLAPRGVVFVADGAGGGETTSTAIHRALEANHMPLEVQTFKWSHGFGRSLADQRDRAHARERGHELAELVSAYRRSYPNNEIYLVAHSAGSCVALEAAEALPPRTIER